MGRLSAFSVAGLDLWFNSSDHLPPHFHARRAGEWEIRVLFLLCAEGHLEYQVKWMARKRGISPADLGTLLERVLPRRELLLEEWEAKVRPRDLHG